MSPARPPLPLAEEVRFLAESSDLNEREQAALREAAAVLDALYDALALALEGVPHDAECETLRGTPATTAGYAPAIRCSCIVRTGIRAALARARQAAP